jgi:hypothetical protein
MKRRRTLIGLGCLLALAFIASSLFWLGFNSYRNNSEVKLGGINLYVESKASSVYKDFSGSYVTPYGLYRFTWVTMGGYVVVCWYERPLKAWL